MSALASRPSVGSVNSNDGQPDNTDPSQYKILALTFNQDCTALAMGTLKNYHLFTINQDHNVDEIHNCAYEEIRILERLYSSSLIALVSSQATRKLKVCNFREGTEICSYAFGNTILSVKLNRSRLVVCLDDSIYIHNMRDMKVLHTIRDVPSNPDGLCALSTTDTNPYLAYPGSSITGEIQIFDTINLKPGILISAHEGPLAAMTFDMTGTKIATASNKGTVIRIHNALDGTCLFEFRRGVRRVAQIYSLAFSPDALFLAASSNTGTVHIFRLTNQKDKAPEENNSWMGTFKRLTGGVAGFLPTQASEVLTQDRAFATVHLQSAQMKTTIAMNTFNKSLNLFVAGYDGVVSVYEVNMNDGGECKQLSQYLLFDISQNANNQKPKTSNERRNTDGSVQSIPPNLLRINSNTTQSSATLINGRYLDDQSYNTAIDDRSFPPLSSTPQVDND